MLPSEKEEVKMCFWILRRGQQWGDIVQKLGLKEEDIAIRLVNCGDGRLDTQFREGDYISLFPPVGGG